MPVSSDCDELLRDLRRHDTVDALLAARQILNADARAQRVKRAVDAFPRGAGRVAVAVALDVQVRQVDRAISRAKSAPAETGLTPRQLASLRAVLAGIALDPAWADNPGGHLAAEASGSGLPDAADLAARAAAWSYPQALAVILSLRPEAAEALDDPLAGP